MPFTPTHLAAAVPIAWLCRWRVPFTALAIGTMVSDMGVFFPWMSDYRVTHSALGILTHCTPIGLAIYYVYHVILKRPMLDLLPLAARNRLLQVMDRPVDFRLRQVLLVAMLIAIGASTHVFWDSFTHRGRWGVSMLPILNGVAFESNGWPIHWYTVLQHGCSAIFLPPLTIGFLLWVWRNADATCEDNRFRVPLWASWPVMAAIFVGGVIRMFWIQFLNPDYLIWMHSFRFAVKDTGALMMFILLAYCIGMQLIWIMAESREGPPAESPSPSGRPIDS